MKLSRGDFTLGWIVGAAFAFFGVLAAIMSGRSGGLGSNSTCIIPHFGDTTNFANFCQSNGNLIMMQSLSVSTIVIGLAVLTAITVLIAVISIAIYIVGDE